MKHFKAQAKASMAAKLKRYAGGASCGPMRRAAGGGVITEEDDMASGLDSDPDSPVEGDDAMENISKPKKMRGKDEKKGKATTVNVVIMQSPPKDGAEMPPGGPGGPGGPPPGAMPMPPPPPPGAGPGGPGGPPPPMRARGGGVRK